MLIDSLHFFLLHHRKKVIYDFDLVKKLNYDFFVDVQPKEGIMLLDQLNLFQTKDH
jgi:hypothetical protein